MCVTTIYSNIFTKMFSYAAYGHPLKMFKEQEGLHTVFMLPIHSFIDKVSIRTGSLSGQTNGVLTTRKCTRFTSHDHDTWWVWKQFN